MLKLQQIQSVQGFKGATPSKLLKVYNMLVNEKRPALSLFNVLLLWSITLTYFTSSQTEPVTFVICFELSLGALFSVFYFSVYKILVFIYNFFAGV